MNLLRSVAAHEVHIGGRSYDVAPPSVLHALQIIYSAVSASKGDQEAVTELKAAARAWLPRRLYWTLFPPRWMFWRQVAAQGGIELTTRIVSLGAPEAKERPKKRGEKEPTPQEAVERFLKTDWTLQVAEVSHAFHLPPDAVLSMPWPLFYQLIEKADAMRARWQIDYQAAKSLPYIEKDHERTKAFEALHARAGYKEEKTREEKLAEQRRTLEAMKKQMKASF